MIYDSFDLRFFEGMQRAQDAAADKSYSFAIFAREAGLAGEILGWINLSNIVRGSFRACYLGYSLAASVQGKGLMTEGLRTIIPYAFNELHLHRIMTNYMPHNTRMPPCSHA